MCISGRVDAAQHRVCRALLRAPQRRSPSFMLAPSGSRLAPVLATPADVRRRGAADDCLAGSPETLLKPYTTPADSLGPRTGRSRSMPASPAAAAAAAAAFGGQGFRAARLGFPLGSPTTEWLRDAAAAAEQGLRGGPQSVPGSGQNPAPMPWLAKAPRPVGAAGVDQLGGGGGNATEGSVRGTGDAQSGGRRGHAGGRVSEHTGELRKGAADNKQASEAGAPPAPQGAAALSFPSEPGGSRAGGAASNAFGTASASAAACRGAPRGVPAHSAAADAAAPPRRGPGTKPCGNSIIGARARARMSADEDAGLRPGPVFVPIVLCMDEGDHALLVREWYERRRQAGGAHGAADPAEALARLQALQVMQAPRFAHHTAPHATSLVGSYSLQKPYR